MMPFLDVWIPIAKRFFESRLASLSGNKLKKGKKTLVMVHVPEEGQGLPVKLELLPVHVLVRYLKMLLAHL